MLYIEWVIVVIGWTVIFLTLSLTHLKLYRLGSGLYSVENKCIHREKFMVRAITVLYWIVAAIISSNSYFTFFDGLQRNDSVYYYVTGGGLLFFIGAIVMFIYARMSLCIKWTWSGCYLKDRKKLITKGPYAKIRHPLYMSYIIAGFASSLILTDSRIFVFVLLVIPVIYWRGVIEDQQLSMIFPEYKEYQKRTRMFF